MKEDQKQPHNNFFVKQFSNLQLALSFFRNYLPADIVRAIDWSIFRQAPTDFVSKALKNRKSDIIYETRIKNQKCFFYLHLEHQRTSAPDMAFRMLSYWFSIMEQHRQSYPEQPLPLIFPIVLYQGKKPWTAAKDIHSYLEVPKCMEAHTPQFRYVVIDLSHLSDDQIQGELILRATLLIMKHIDNDNVEEVLNPRTLELFQELLQKKTGLEHIRTILYYLFSAGRELDKEKVVQIIQKLPKKPKLKEVIMTLAEQWKAEGMEKGRVEGMEKGIEKGREEGKRKGNHQLMLKQLQFKFREKTTPYLDRLEQASQDELELIAERILTKSKISSVFEGIGE